MTNDEFRMTNDEAAHQRPAKAILFSQPSPWIRDHSRDDFPVSVFPPGSRVLDVGCGFGKNLLRMRDAGIQAQGIDVDPEGLDYCRSLGFDVATGPAEKIDYPDATFDGVVIDGVLAFTDPVRAFAETRRVLKNGGTLLLTASSIGYGLYTCLSRRGRARWFGARMMASQPWFDFTGRRLGDTLCFSRQALTRLCEDSRFKIERLETGRPFCGLPVFYYLQARRV